MSFVEDNEKHEMELEFFRIKQALIEKEILNFTIMKRKEVLIEFIQNLDNNIIK